MINYPSKPNLHTHTVYDDKIFHVTLDREINKSIILISANWVFQQPSETCEHTLCLHTISKVCVRDLGSYRVIKIL